MRLKLAILDNSNQDLTKFNRVVLFLGKILGFVGRAWCTYLAPLCPCVCSAQACLPLKATGVLHMVGAQHGTQKHSWQWVSQVDFLVILFLTVPFTAAKGSAVRDLKAICMVSVSSSTGLTSELIAALIYTQVPCSRAAICQRKD